MLKPKVGEPFQVEDTPKVLEVELVEWEAARIPPPRPRNEYFVVRTAEGERYLLFPHTGSHLDVQWQGIPLQGAVE